MYNVGLNRAENEIREFIKQCIDTHVFYCLEINGIKIKKKTTRMSWKSWKLPNPLQRYEFYLFLYNNFWLTKVHFFILPHRIQLIFRWWIMAKKSKLDLKVLQSQKITMKIIWNHQSRRTHHFQTRRTHLILNKGNISACQ